MYTRWGKQVHTGELWHSESRKNKTKCCWRTGLFFVHDDDGGDCDGDDDDDNDDDDADDDDDDYNDNDDDDDDDDVEHTRRSPYNHKRYTRIGVRQSNFTRIMRNRTIVFF